MKELVNFLLFFAVYFMCTSAFLVNLSCQVSLKTVFLFYTSLQLNLVTCHRDVTLNTCYRSLALAVGSKDEENNSESRSGCGKYKCQLENFNKRGLFLSHNCVFIYLMF